MAPAHTLKDWKIADLPDGHLEVVGKLVDAAGIGGGGLDHHTGPLLRIVGLRLILARDGAIYRLLPQAAGRTFAPEFLQRMGPASWQGKRGKHGGENHT